MTVGEGGVSPLRGRRLCDCRPFSEPRVPTVLVGYNVLYIPLSGEAAKRRADVRWPCEYETDRPSASGPVEPRWLRLTLELAGVVRT